MRASAMRRCARFSAASLARSGGCGRACILLQEESVPALQAMRGSLSGIPDQPHGFAARGFAKQPPAADVPVDHEHTNIGNEIEKELLKASETSGVSGLLQVVEAHGEDFDEQNVATAFHELAAAAKDQDLKDVHVHDAFKALVDMAIMGRRRFNARLLTSIVQSAAGLKFSDEALLDKLSQNLLGRMDKLDAIEVTDLATGLAEMDHSPSVVLFEALQKRANDIQADFSQDQNNALKTAFEKLGYGDYAKKL